MRIDQNIYNHLSTALVPKKRNVTHKSSELRAVYNNMAKYNKNSPLYLLSLSEQKQSYMINIKEAAITLKDVSDSFSNTDSDIYTKKSLHSADEDAVSGSIRTSNYGDIPDTLNIRIESLASEQINIGDYLNASEHAFTQGDYRFSLETINGTSHFNVHVGNDSNMEVQSRLAQYINNRSIGVHASVISEGNSSALMLSSADTGKPSSEDGLYFSFISEGSRDIVGMLGINNVDTAPSNSHFFINDTPHSSSSNHISINQAIELDFHRVTDKPVALEFVPDINTAMGHIDMFVDAYNSLVDLSGTGSNRIGTRNLFNDISGLVFKHKTELEDAGLNVDDANHIVKNKNVLTENIRSGDFAKLFSKASSFKDDVEGATNRLTLDPMAYVNKLIVTYPNTANKSNTPYTQSLYSGLMYNNYA